MTKGDWFFIIFLTIIITGYLSDISAQLEVISKNMAKMQASVTMIEQNTDQQCLGIDYAEPEWTKE